MNIVYFDKTDVDIPSDLISIAKVSKMTGYYKYNLLPSSTNKLKIKDYCTIYRYKHKQTHCIFYSKQEVLEFLGYNGLERVDTFNKDKFYTYKDIALTYGLYPLKIRYLISIIRQINTGCLLKSIKTINIYTVKKTHYIEKKSVDELMEVLGYKKRNN